MIPNVNKRPMAPPSDDLRARVLAEVLRAPAPTRAEHQRRTTLLVGLGVLATAALFFLTARIKLGGRPSDLVALTAGSALLGALVLGRASSARSSGSMLGRPRTILVAACLLAAPALALVAIESAMLWPEQAAEEVAGRMHLACGALTLVQGSLPLAVLVLLRRGSDPVHPALTGAALGATAGAWAAAMAYLRCPHVALTHSIAAHVLPVVVLAVAGALAGRALIKIR